jgi:tetratricopeptide (TPR) repeat protein
VGQRALDWALASGQTELGLRLAGALTLVWLDKNVAVEGEARFRALFEQGGSVDEEVLAKALMTASMVAGVRSNFDQAAEWGEQALRLYRAAGSERGIAWALTTYVLAPMELGKLEDAGSMLDEAETLHRKHGDTGGVRRVLHLKGQQAAAVGDVERSRRTLREAAELSLSEADTFSAASSFHSLGDLELQAGELDAAEAAYEEALRIAWDTGADRLVCYGLAGLAAVASDRLATERTALLWGFVEAYEERLRFTMRRRSLYAERLDAAAAAQPAKREEGRRLSLDEAVERALGDKR